MASTAEVYEPPRLLVFLQKTLSIPRQEYSTNFSALFDDSVEEDAYREGIIFLSCILGGILFLWIFILLVLKFNANSVGCASGSAFLPEIDSFDDPSNLDHSAGSYGHTESYELRSHEENSGQYSDEIYDGSSFRSSIPSQDDQSSFQSETLENSIASAPLFPSSRERRTQFVFFLFGLLTLACIPIAHIYAFIPLRDSANGAAVQVEEIREVLDEVEASVGTVSSGLKNIKSILDRLPLTEREVCPQVDSIEIERILGFRIEEMIEVYHEDYILVAKQASTDIDEVTRMLSIIEETIEIVDNAAKETENYVWLLPGILLGLSALTAIVLFGAFLSWKRDSNRRLQRFLSYVVLPLLVLTSFVCWALAIAAAAGTAVSSDVCMAGRPDGSPAATVQSILAAKAVEKESLLYRFASAYSTGCKIDDPTRVLSEHESKVLAIVETIWQYLSAVDSAGRASLRGLCGEGNEITPFLVAFRDLAKQLTSMSRALDSATKSMSCSRVHEIFDEAVNQSLCVEVASASASGFLIFFALGLTTLTMISLRASWRHHIDEDKIYDESEVAENMIVDEHEEYLAYISKYKHEWEEYGGFETTLSQQRTMPEESIGTASKTLSHSPSDVGSHPDEVDNSLGPSEGSDSSEGSITEKRANNGLAEAVSYGCTKDDPFDPYNSDSRSLSTTNSEDISFLSLNEMRTPKSSQSPEPTPMIILPPLLYRSTAPVEPEDLASLPPPILAPVLADSSQPNKTEASSSTVSDLRRQPQNEEHSQPVKKNPSADRIMSGLDEMDNLVSTTGESIDLKQPPILQRRSAIPSPARPSPSSVKFAVDSGPSPTLVQERVGRFSKSKHSKPLTPTRGNTTKLKDLASKFDSPSSPTRHT